MPRTMELSASPTRTDSRPTGNTATSRFTGQRIHFIGIGGSGMAGLARMLVDNGALVTGSEPNPNSQTFDLQKRGVKITREQTPEYLPDQLDLVVRTAAVKDNNPQFQAAASRQIKTVKYAQLLGMIMAERFGIAVAGTHGKSTTTAMIAYALTHARLDPSFVVGGSVPQLGSVGSQSGSGKTFIAEACEFDRSFHNLHPRVALLTNIEEDHLDCYRNLEEIIQSFRQFACLVPPTGLLITNATDPNVAKALSGLTTPTESCSLTKTSATWFTEPQGIESGCPKGQIFYNSRPIGTLHLSIPGAHNLINATMAVAACNAAGADLAPCIDALNRFTGVDRRMTLVGTCNGATIVDDYGHHPTEIRATLKALHQRFTPKRLLCVFQPHQHSRTRFLLNDFATAFKDADETIVPDIYFVRDSESERQAINSNDLVSRIEQNGQKATHLPTFAQILSHLKAELREGDVLVTMGAGNVWEIARDLVT